MDLSENGLHYQLREGEKGETIYKLLDSVIDFDTAMELARVIDACIEKSDCNIILDMEGVKEVDKAVWSGLSVIRVNQNNKGKTLEVRNFDIPDTTKAEWGIDG